MPGPLYDRARPGGGHTGLYRPPASSPSSSIGYLPSKSRPTTFTSRAEPTSAKRKRLGQSPQRDRFPDTHGDAILSRPRADSTSLYDLAASVDTNGDTILGESMYSDSDFRRGLGAKRTTDDLLDAAPGTLFDVRPEPSTPSRGWGSLAVDAIGGVVGRVWEFCRAGAFNGFHAGGGQGFHVREDGTIAPPDASIWDDAMDGYPSIPGRFPNTEPDEDYTTGAYTTSWRDNDGHESTGSTSSRPTTKRRQIGQADDLGRNWVVVGEQGEARSRSQTPIMHRPSPRNRNHVPSVTTGRRISTPSGARPSSSSRATPASTPRRMSAAPNPFTSSTPTHITNVPRPSSSASFASPRITPKRPQPTRPSQASTPRRRTVAPQATSISHRRTGSGASVASPHNRGAPPADVKDSPRIDPETKRAIARKKREQRETDAQMSSFNKRLEDMIRQGQEALGATVEIENTEGQRWEDDD